MKIKLVIVLQFIKIRSTNTDIFKQIVTVFWIIFGDKTLN